MFRRSRFLVELDMDSNPNPGHSHTVFGAMIQIDIIERGLWLKLHGIKVSANIKPAHRPQHKSISAHETVPDGLSNPVTRVVCPGSEVASICNLLLSRQLLVVSSVAEARTRPGFVDNSLEYLLKVFHLIDRLYLEGLFELLLCYAKVIDLLQLDTRVLVLELSLQLVDENNVQEVQLLLLLLITSLSIWVNKLLEGLADERQLDDLLEGKELQEHDSHHHGPLPKELHKLGLCWFHYLFV